jgi:hypothetical protein
MPNHGNSRFLEPIFWTQDWTLEARCWIREQIVVRFFTLASSSMAMSALAMALTLAPQRAQAFDGGPDSGYFYIATPGGFVDSSCYHVIPSGLMFHLDGGILTNDAGTIVGSIPRCEFSQISTGPLPDSGVAPDGGYSIGPGLYRGPVGNPPAKVNWAWLDYNWASPSSQPGTEPWFEYIGGVYSVPPEPVNFGSQLIYIFLSETTSDPSESSLIIQPVLQWGSNCAGNFWCNFFGAGNGGNHWQISNWIYGGTYGAIQDSPTTVNVGDQISSWVLNANFDGWGPDWDEICYQDTSASGPASWVNCTYNNSLSTINFDQAQPSVLEVYNVNTCADLPNMEGTGGILEFVSPEQIYQAGSENNSYINNGNLWRGVGDNSAIDCGFQTADSICPTGTSCSGYNYSKLVVVFGGQ